MPNAHELAERQRLTTAIVAQLAKLSPERQAKVVALVKRLNHLQTQGVAIPDELWTTLGLELRD